MGGSRGGSLGAGWSLSQLTLGKRQGTPWTSHQFIAGLTHRDRQPFTPTGNLESPNNLSCRSLDCRRKPEYPERIRADTRRTCKLHTHTRGVEPRTFLLC